MLLKLIKNEKFIFLHKKLHLIVLAELISVIYAFISDNNFTVEELSTSSYLNLSITIRYFLVSFVICNVFSGDIAKGLYKTYIAVGYNRTLVFISKLLLCVGFAIISNIIGVTIFISIFIIKRAFSYIFFKQVILITVCNLLPLICFIIEVILVDLLILNSTISLIVATSLVTFSSLLPYNIAKWISLTYSNVSIVFDYGDSKSIIQMIFTLILSTIVFFALNIIIILRLDIREQ